MTSDYTDDQPVLILNQTQGRRQGILIGEAKHEESDRRPGGGV